MMGMSKHTQGPWQWSLEKGAMSSNTIKINAPTVLDKGISDWKPRQVIGGCGCCGSPWTADDWDEAVANARLIAAAPDLLAVVKALNRIASALGSSHEGEEWSTLIEAARAAVSKTEGAP